MHDTSKGDIVSIDSLELRLGPKTRFLYACAMAAEQTQAGQISVQAAWRSPDGSLRSTERSP